MSLTAATPQQAQEAQELDPAALKVLREITGETEPTLKNFLVTAAILGKSSPEYKKIAKYVKNGQVHHFGLTVDKIIRLRRRNEAEFPAQNGTGHEFRMLLWHGTKRACILGIIKGGFAIPDQRRQMFGLGTYFADRATKSAQYCGKPILAGQQGYLLLCDVKVGNMYKAKTAHHEYRKAPPGYDSVKCCGSNIPDWKSNEDFGGALMPLGLTVKNGRFPSYATIYNEYAIYEPEQISLRYLVIVNIESSPQ